MKQRLMATLLMTSVLVISAAAQNGGAQTTNSPTQAQVRPESRAAEGYSHHSRDNGQGTIVVDVWSSATPDAAKPKEAEPDKLSSAFAHAAVSAAFRMQSTERKLEYCIKNRYPLNELWIQADLDSIDESLAQASVSATNDADREALQQLQSQSSRLRQWSDWLIEQNRHLRLANYYMSASGLDSDQQFQSSVGCTNFLVSMLSSGRLAENYSCR
jgi:peptidyl-tRNA hydrolase